VVVDFPEDTTVPVVEKFGQEHSHVRAVVSTYGRGPANAIRFGIDQAESPVVVVTMADGSDDPRQIDDLARLVDRGVVVAAASRYSAGGQQVGGPLLKGMMSRNAGRSLGVFARVGTRDATNSFKAYSTEFVREVGIHSRSGFEIGLELTAKARRLRRPVAELPTIWLDRDLGQSNFKLKQWIPKYLRWYRFAFGPPLTLEELTVQAERIARLNQKS
jgi:glycosyltransferase involved in cell wall biosynthesis